MNSIDAICWSKYGYLLNKTINWFKKHGKTYRSTPWREYFLYKYSKGIGLDLGCGLASTTRELVKNNYLDKLFLLDIVEETLYEICNLCYNIFCIRSDVLRIPFRDNIFDTVYILAVLHHIPGEECRISVLEEIYRVLKPGGNVIITTWSPDLGIFLNSVNYIKQNDRSFVIIDRYGQRYFYFYELNELIKQIRGIGFEIVEYNTFIQNPSKPNITKNIYIVASKPSFY